jgi:hypothetical protein
MQNLKIKIRNLTFGGSIYLSRKKVDYKKFTWRS